MIVTVLVVLTAYESDAECCSSAKNGMCGDKWYPPPKYCCGVGDCNIFCCNCDGGCIPGSFKQLNVDVDVPIDNN